VETKGATLPQPDPHKLGWAWSFTSPQKQGYARTSIPGQVGIDLKYDLHLVTVANAGGAYEKQFSVSHVHGKICFDGAFIVPVLADEQQKNLGTDVRFVPVVPDVTELTPPEVSVLRYARGMADCPNLVLHEKPSLQVEPIKSLGCDTVSKVPPGARHAGDIPVGRTSSIKFMGRFWKLHAEVLLSCTSIPSVFIPLSVYGAKPASMTLGDITARIAAQYWFAYKYKEDKARVKETDVPDYITRSVCETYSVRFKATYPGHKVSSKWFGVELTNTEQAIFDDCETAMTELTKTKECQSACAPCFANNQHKLREARCSAEQVNLFCKDLEDHQALQLSFDTIYLYTPQIQIEVAMGVVASLRLNTATVIDPLGFTGLSSKSTSQDGFVEFDPENNMKKSYKKAKRPIIRLCSDFSGSVVSLSKGKQIRRSYPSIDTAHLMTSFVVNNIAAEMAMYNLVLSESGGSSSPILTHIVTDAVTGTVYAMERSTASEVIDGLYLSSSMNSLDATQRYVTEPCFMFVPGEPTNKKPYCTESTIHDDTFKQLRLNVDLKLSANIQKMVSNIGTGQSKVTMPKTWHMGIADGQSLELVSDSTILTGACGNSYSSYPQEEQVVSMLSKETSPIEFHIDLTSDIVPSVVVYAAKSTPTLMGVGDGPYLAPDGPKPPPSCTAKPEPIGDKCSQTASTSHCTAISFLPGLQAVAGALTLTSKDDSGASIDIFKPQAAEGDGILEIVNSHEGHLVYTSKLSTAWVNKEGTNSIEELALIVSSSVDYTQEYSDKSCMVMTIPTGYQTLHDEVAGPLSGGVFHMGIVDNSKKTRGGSRDEEARVFRTTLYVLLAMASLVAIIFLVSKLSSAGRGRKVRSRK
jgi:hypothetical protein